MRAEETTNLNLRPFEFLCSGDRATGSHGAAVDRSFKPLRAGTDPRQQGSAAGTMTFRAGATRLPSIHETSSATRASVGPGHVPGHERVHGGPDLRRVLLKILGQAVSAVDLSLLLPESLLHHVLHHVVDHCAPLLSGMNRWRLGRVDYFA